MLKHVFFAFVAVLVFLILAFPALSADRPKTASAPAKVPPPALTADETAKLARLRALPPPNPNLTLVATVSRASSRPPHGRTEIYCAVYVTERNPTIMTGSTRLFFVNTTPTDLAPGALIEWEVAAGPCCRGSGSNSALWPANPPSPAFLLSESILAPGQPWNRPCRAWVTPP